MIDEDYNGYISETDWRNIREAANCTVSAMARVGGRPCIPGQSAGLSPTFGAGDDLSFGRFQVDTTRDKVYVFTMGFAYPTKFYPTAE